MFAARISLINGNKSLISKLFGIGSVRSGHRLRGRPPGGARSIVQRLEGMLSKEIFEVRTLFLNVSIFFLVNLNRIEV